MTQGFNLPSARETWVPHCSIPVAWKDRGHQQVSRWTKQMRQAGVGGSDRSSTVVPGTVYFKEAPPPLAHLTPRSPSSPSSATSSIMPPSWSGARGPGSSVLCADMPPVRGTAHGAQQVLSVYSDWFPGSITEPPLHRCETSTSQFTDVPHTQRSVRHVPVRWTLT